MEFGHFTSSPLRVRCDDHRRQFITAGRQDRLQSHVVDEDQIVSGQD
jgi:hypothetical protein